MVSKKHQKKRNAGLLYEFVVRSISQSLVEGNQKRANSAVRLVKKFFRPGTELHREFRLINSLVQTTVSTEAVAASIMQEAKAAARTRDVARLEHEKSLLIASLNRLGDEDLYDRPVNGYKVYATVQTLVNDWRAADADLGRMAQYEDQLVKHLVEAKQPVQEPSVGDNAPGTGRLLMKVMMKRLNEKYAVALTGDQKRLLRAYAFSAASDDPQSITMKLREVKDGLLKDIDANANDPELGEHVVSKLADVRKQVDAEELATVDDATVTRFMVYTRLAEELKREEGDGNV